MIENSTYCFRARVSNCKHNQYCTVFIYDIVSQGIVENRVTHDCASILDTIIVLLRGLLVPTIFRMVHPFIQ